jgi:hypothetical protein
LKVGTKISVILALLTAISIFLGLASSGLAEVAGGGGTP